MHVKHRDVQRCLQTDLQALASKFNEVSKGVSSFLVSKNIETPGCSDTKVARHGGQSRSQLSSTSGFLCLCTALILDTSRLLLEGDYMRLG